MDDEMRIMLRYPDEPWRTPEVNAYDNERALQDLLVESPDLLPGISFAAVLDELHIPETGSVDLVLVEPSGAITLVECKLVANPEIRRAVVGQILSYAANLWRLSYEILDNRFRQRTGASLASATEAAQGDHGAEWDEEGFRVTVAENLAAGRFRLIIAVDQITEELKRVVEYLNTHTTADLEFLALELGYVADKGVEILLPRVHGEESARIKGGSSPSRAHQWTPDDVFDALETLSGPHASAAARKLAEDVTRRGGRIRTGKGQYPTLSGDVPFEAGVRAVWAVHADPSRPTAPRISVNFGSLRSVLSTEELEQLLTSLEAIGRFAEHLAEVRDVDFNLYPSIPLSKLASPDIVDQFLTAIEPWLPPPTSATGP